MVFSWLHCLLIAGMHRASRSLMTNAIHFKCNYKSFFQLTVGNKYATIKESTTEELLENPNTKNPSLFCIIFIALTSFLGLYRILLAPV